VAIKIKVRLAGQTIFQELELPEGIEVRDVQIITQGMSVCVEKQDKGWRSGQVNVSHYLNELEDVSDQPKLYFTVGEVTRDPDDQNDASWVWRSDVLLYSRGEQIIAMNHEINSKSNEKIIVKKGWRNSHHPLNSMKNFSHQEHMSDRIEKELREEWAKEGKTQEEIDALIRNFF
jgi:hypothetical protein